MEAKRHIAERGEDIPHVVEKHAVDVGADKRETQLDVVVEQRVPTQRESGRLRCGTAGDQGGSRIPWPGLVEREGAQGVGATAKEPLGERNGFLV